jgi:hypothetical protein
LDACSETSCAERGRDVRDDAKAAFLGHPAISLRDHFAGMALQGLIASNDSDAGDRIEELPRYAYAIADAMIAERDKP